MARREEIILTVQDLVSELLYYGRKNDEDLPVGQIEEAISAGEITADDIVAAFNAELYKRLAE